MEIIGLLSELVMVDSGKYIVKVTISNEKMILSTALASADTVEKAEDEARKRAIAILDFTKNLQLTPLSLDTISTLRSPNKINSATPEKTIDNSPLKTNKIKEQIPPTKIENTLINSQETITQTAIESPLLAIEEIEPVTIVEIFNQNPEEEIAEVTDIATMDFDQIINQTNIELKRLGWSKEDGKKYLLETYGKPSRLVLSNQELIEFLTYLQTL